MKPNRFAMNVGRRTILSGGLAGIAYALSARFSGEENAYAQAAAPTTAPRAAAKSCIVLWLNGGPSHLDTFDPKPGTGASGPFKAIASKASAIHLSEHLPQLAAEANEIAVIRGMTSKEGSHPRAQELGRTGHTPNPTVATPALGAWIAKHKPVAGLDLPGFISFAGPSIGAGFLGHEYDPLVLQNPGEAPQNLNPYQELSSDRWKVRRAVLAEMDADFAKRTGDRQVVSRDAIFGRAVKMMQTPQVKAFEIASEPEAVKKAYGDSSFGRGCLAARRLVEKGVPFVEVTLDGWDTHQNNFDKTQKLMGALDPAFATLIKELRERKLLESTVILCMGEFGRTPTINSNQGRDHYPQAWSAVLAGGGFRGGIVHGSTDDEGRKVVKDPVTVPDLLSTVSSRLGLDPNTSEITPRGRPISVTEDGNIISALIG